MRRLETQADCFSGMFIRAVSESIGVQRQDEPGIEDIYVAIGDDTLTNKPDIVGNHGLGRSRKYWGIEMIQVLIFYPLFISMVCQ